ncbi:aldo/keto reductase [Arsenicitalea aurantiaca]|uniref:Aldo/keto reductase n=1 Tax=Arsenicitalea aurantiaca TaxID=1783274 RepID=A0A433XKE2_9HYPH|nr:aldo/keto reductase [Arsenicitalea aurantiaca]RUT34523.1 aldo/keto reductase [Arsenicitalea aurantiaca]
METVELFRIGGDIEVRRLGFGSNRLSGPGFWGPPSDPAAARALLRMLPDLGINFIDTAESYGPYITEELIGDEIGPRADIVVSTKGGYIRTGPHAWHCCGRPEFLRQGVLTSIRRLKRERLDLWHLHRIDPAVPRDEQFGAIAEMREEGLIRYVGLSDVSVVDIEAAIEFFPVATVQNHYNLLHRAKEEVLAYCEQHSIGFMPFFPLADGKLNEARGMIDASRAIGATPAQLALAWLLHRSPVILPIPGTSNPAHLRSNLAAAGLELDQSTFDTLSAIYL